MSVSAITVVEDIHRRGVCENEVIMVGEMRIDGTQQLISAEPRLRDTPTQYKAVRWVL